MNYKYTGTHSDLRAVHGVGEVQAGTVITPRDKQHEQAIKDSGLFETTKEKPDTPEDSRTYSVQDVKGREDVSLGEAAKASDSSAATSSTSAEKSPTSAKKGADTKE